jgi:hypothetical protein
MQTTGKAIIRAELAKLGHSDFAGTERGRLLIAEVESLLGHNCIIFSAQLKGHRGLSWADWWGPRIVFIRIIEVNDNKYIHQLPSQITESLFHEALHALRGKFHRTSVEEECDAFAAGLCAEAASKGIHPPDLLTVDGKPLAEFVMTSYPGARRDPGYQPLGESTDWLRARTGLTGPRQ